MPSEQFDAVEGEGVGSGDAVGVGSGVGLGVADDVGGGGAVGSGVGRIVGGDVGAAAGDVGRGLALADGRGVTNGDVEGTGGAVGGSDVAIAAADPPSSGAWPFAVASVLDASGCRSWSCGGVGDGPERPAAADAPVAGEGPDGWWPLNAFPADPRACTRSEAPGGVQPTPDPSSGRLGPKVIVRTRLTATASTEAMAAVTARGFR